MDERPLYIIHNTRRRITHIQQVSWPVGPCGAQLALPAAIYRKISHPCIVKPNISRSAIVDRLDRLVWVLVWRVVKHRGVLRDRTELRRVFLEEQ